MPSALAVQSGGFVPVHEGDGPIHADGDGVPKSLPSSLAEVADGSSRQSAKRGDGTDQVTLFLTVDTEDAYFTRPHLITGDGVGREFGVFGILDELDSASMRATFFVNVYEAERQPPGAVEGVVREIAARGHEVALHTHPSPALDFYQRPLFRLTRAHQAEVLRWGADRIERWAGVAATSFRAGAYAVNEDTLETLGEIGIEIDSSCFFQSPNNHLDPFTVNALSRYGDTIEVPVTTVLRARPDGRLQRSKLDLDWLSIDQLTAALRATATHGAGFATFMMHSFSFIDRSTRRPEEPPSQRALFRSETLFNRYAEIYGPRPERREAFRTFLAGIAGDRALRVRTLSEALPDLRVASAAGLPDLVPVVRGD